MKKGDVIKKVEGAEVTDCRSFKDLVAGSGGGTLAVTVERNGKPVDLEIRPTAAGTTYQLGVYLRDSMAGIGTVTFYDPATQTYGALGHGVNDLESMVLLPLEDGEILPSRWWRCRRAPGARRAC